MTTQEFATIREQLVMSDETLASKLGVTTRLIKKWGEGRVAIGERFALAIRHYVRRAARSEPTAAA